MLSPRPAVSLLFLVACLACSLPSLARAQEVVSVPKKEWEEMKRQMAEMHRELKELKSARATAPQPGAAPAEIGRRAPTSALAALSQKVTELTGLVNAGRPGDNQILLSGDASGNFTYDDRSRADGFDARFSPLVLWRLNESLMFEAKVDFNLGSREIFYGYSYGTTDVNLAYAQLDWAIDDRFTLVLGKFRSPINAFAERFEPSWINPLPDAPLGLYEILPSANVGAQLRGVFPLWYPGGKITGAAFVSNAPLFTTGSVPYYDFGSVRWGTDNIAAGGRLGLQFCPNLELGYGVEYANAQTGYAGYNEALWLHSVDLVTWLDALRGRWTLQAQYAWSHIDLPTYRRVDEFSLQESSIASGKNGGYVQLSYRGRKWESDFANRLEFIVRADRSATSGFFNRYLALDEDPPRTIYDYASDGYETNRFTFGIDYWLGEYTVLKAAYEHTGSDFGDSNRVIVGFGTGL